MPLYGHATICLSIRLLMAHRICLIFNWNISKIISTPQSLTPMSPLRAHVLSLSIHVLMPYNIFVKKGSSPILHIQNLRHRRTEFLDPGGIISLVSIPLHPSWYLWVQVTESEVHVESKSLGKISMQCRLMQKTLEFCVLPRGLLNTLREHLSPGRQPPCPAQALITSLLDALSLLLIASEPL